MAATVDDKSDVGDQPNQFEDDQKNELLPAEKKESDLNAPDDEKKGGDFGGSNLPEKTRHPLATSCNLFPLHAWLYFLYIALAILLPIFGTLLIICGNWSNTGYFSLFAILNYPWPKLKLEDPNYTATSLELLQVSLVIFSNIKIILSWRAGSLVSSSGSSLSTSSMPLSSTTSCSGTSSSSPSPSCSCSYSSSSASYSPGPGGRGTDRLGATCARLLTTSSAGGRWQSNEKSS